MQKEQKRLLTSGGGLLAFPQGFWRKLLRLKASDCMLEDSTNGGNASYDMLNDRVQSDVHGMLDQVQHDVNNFVKRTYSKNRIIPLSRKGRGKCASPFTKNLAAFTLAEGATHVDTSNNVRRAAFTLAEVLITLGIIGIVAALTMPSLIANYQKSQFEAGVKKMASVVGQAVTKLMADEGVNKVTETSLLYDPTDNGDNINKLGGEFLDKYFNVVGKCETYEKCFVDDYKPSTKNSTNEPFGIARFSEDACRLLADGVSICVFAGGGIPVNVIFDLNGTRSPNRYGYDLFTFSVFYDGSVSEVPPGRCRQSGVTTGCSASSIELKIENCKDGALYGAGCFTYLQQNGFKIDY